MAIKIEFFNASSSPFSGVTIDFQRQKRPQVYLSMAQDFACQSCNESFNSIIYSIIKTAHPFPRLRFDNELKFYNWQAETAVKQAHLAFCVNSNPSMAQTDLLFYHKQLMPDLTHGQVINLLSIDIVISLRSLGATLPVLTRVQNFPETAVSVGRWHQAKPSSTSLSFSRLSK